MSSRRMSCHWFWSGAACAVLLTWLAVGGPRAPQAVAGTSPYTEVIDVTFAAQRWDEVPVGRLNGRVNCCKPRPKQEMMVYLVRDGGELQRTEHKQHSVRQKGARFDPSFLAIVSGDSVTFVNDEEKDIDHNVYGLGTESFDLGIFARGSHEQHVFVQPGEVALHCSVHKMMDAKVFVAPSPAHAVLSGDQEAFTIEGVPAGNYRLRTYQKFKRFRDVDQPVTVTAGQNTTVTVELER